MPLGCHLDATWVPLGCCPTTSGPVRRTSPGSPSRRDDGRETIEHHILYCPAYHAERQVMLTTIAAAEGVEEKLLQQVQALQALQALQTL